jgi:hypothetical protein
MVAGCTNIRVISIKITIRVVMIMILLKAYESYISEIPEYWHIHKPVCYQRQILNLESD